MKKTTLLACIGAAALISACGSNKAAEKPADGAADAAKAGEGSCGEGSCGGDKKKEGDAAAPAPTGDAAPAPAPAPAPGR